jgi:hypothetical protein
MGGHQDSQRGSIVWTRFGKGRKEMEAEMWAPPQTSVLASGRRWTSDLCRRILSLVTISIGSLAVTLMLGVKVASSVSLREWVLQTSGDAFKILPGNQRGLLVSNEAGSYFVIDLDSGAVVTAGELRLEVSDIAVGAATSYTS